MITCDHAEAMPMHSIREERGDAVAVRGVLERTENVREDMEGLE
jgi:hypothetical protein